MGVKKGEYWICTSTWKLSHVVMHMYVQANTELHTNWSHVSPWSSHEAEDVFTGNTRTFKYLMKVVSISKSIIDQSKLRDQQ